MLISRCGYDTMSYMSKRVFVYGTLMKGMRNSSYMEGATFVGSAKTKSEYELVTNGSIPAIRPGNETVNGEVYEVEDGFLEKLEQWAEIGTGLYDRKEIEIDGKSTIVYLGGDRMFGSDTWEKIPEGDYRTYIESQQKTA